MIWAPTTPRNALPTAWLSTAAYGWSNCRRPSPAYRPMKIVGVERRRHHEDQEPGERRRHDELAAQHAGGEADHGLRQPADADDTRSTARPEPTRAAMPSQQPVEPAPTPARHTRPRSGTRSRAACPSDHRDSASVVWERQGSGDRCQLRRRPLFTRCAPSGARRPPASPCPAGGVRHHSTSSSRENRPMAGP